MTASATDPGFSAARPRPGRLGITLRTALVAWAVAITTLLAFALASLPQQKSSLLESLRSKAYGATVSLRDVAAGAVVNEDYSNVVDHCIEMLKGDPAIDYIVITRQDGFSLVHDRSGWNTRALGGDWLPPVRTPVGAIKVAPLFARRVYAYSQPFDYSGIAWGWIHVGLTLDGYDRNIRTLYRQTGLLAIAGVLGSFAASVLYAKHLVRPILALRATVQRVAGGDLSARASVARSDELGQLAAAVNSMTEALLRRDQTLKEAHDTLERRVAERTAELQQQVEARERTNRQLADTQRRLLQVSREAGMAEIATGVLHNVGNVLNSANVSASLVRDTLRDSELAHLRAAVELLEAHEADLPRFLTADERGRLLVPFLRELATHLAAERERAVQEATALTRNVEHIKEIVAMQQAFARTAAVIEKVDPADLLRHAFEIQRGSTARHHVNVTFELPADLPALATDRHNVVQILTNFVANAVHATKANPPERRAIVGRITRIASDRLAFAVTDNGVGIPPEILPRIFRLGFTTRKDGHGFGLHSGVLAAKALGGSLAAASPGAGQGATFTLVLPLQPPSSPSSA